MNRFFGITGFLGAGQFSFLVWFVICLPFWMGTATYDNMPTPFWRWCVYGAVCAIGLGIVYAFVRYSLKNHWVALRNNAPMPASAWRGVWGIYLSCTVIFGLPAFAFSVWSTRPMETLLYVFLASVSLLLCAHAVRKSCWCVKRGSGVSGFDR